MDLQPSLDDNGGLIRLTLRFVHPQQEQTARLVCNDASITLQWRDTQTLAGRLRVSDAPRRWPHTHGEPALHHVAPERTDFVFADFDYQTDAACTASVERGAEQLLARNRRFAWRSML